MFWTRRLLPAGTQSVERFDWFGSHNPGAMFDSGGNYRDVPSRQHDFFVGDGEGDRPADDHGDLLLGMGMDRKKRSGRVAIADHRLAGAVDHLAGDARVDLLPVEIIPRYAPGTRGRAVFTQNMNQPAKSARDNRKKKTLATPPPVTR